MNTNEIKFVELIKNHPMNFNRKLENIIKLNCVTQVSRQMVLEFVEIYQIIVPSYNVKMLNIGCTACLFSFLKDVANKYFTLASEYEAEEVVILPTIEPTTTVEVIVNAESITGDIVTTDIVEADLDIISNNELPETEDTPTVKKRGRPFKTV